MSDICECMSVVQDDDAAFGAAVPALGLSNKAIYSSDAIEGEEGPDLAPAAQPASMTQQPLEEHLQQSSLWPEVYKIYGHGNEILSLAADPCKEFLASACRAQVIIPLPNGSLKSCQIARKMQASTDVCKQR